MQSVFPLLAALLLAAGAGRAEDRRSPVVVELFTSEGCSSCPPADELLDRLERSMPNVRVIALEEHVDYWNNLGWTDRFSSPLFRARQNEYALYFKSDSIFTPQMVVNGHVQLVGDDADRARYEINRAAASQQYLLRLQPQPNAKDPALTDLSIFVKNSRPGKPEPADVYLAIAETHLTSQVLNGENAGRLLRHGPVVRSFGVIGNIAARPFNEVGLKSTLKTPPEWKSEYLRAVVFVQEHQSRQIIAAAVTSLR